MTRNMGWGSFNGKYLRKLKYINLRPDLRKYIGNWENGKQHGIAYFVTPDG